MHKHRRTLCNYITEVKTVNMYVDMNIMMQSVGTQEVILIIFRPYLKPHVKQPKINAAATFKNTSNNCLTPKTKRVKRLVVASKLGTSGKY